MHYIQAHVVYLLHSYESFTLISLVHLGDYKVPVTALKTDRFILLFCSLTFQGPWSIGEVIEGHTGIIFAWGTIVNGAYLPGSFTYAYGFLQVGTCILYLCLVVISFFWCTVVWYI
jgi:hypothetical protein